MSVRKRCCLTILILINISTVYMKTIPNFVCTDDLDGTEVSRHGKTNAKAIKALAKAHHNAIEKLGDTYTQHATTAATTRKPDNNKVPTTIPPTTEAPSTAPPTTIAPPTTKAPTTTLPTSKSPTIIPPTTEAPTTTLLTSKAPTLFLRTVQSTTTIATNEQPNTTDTSTTLATTKSATTETFTSLATTKSATTETFTTLATTKSTTTESPTINPVSSSKTTKTPTSTSVSSKKHRILKAKTEKKIAIFSPNPLLLTAKAKTLLLTEKTTNSYKLISKYLTKSGEWQLPEVDPPGSWIS